MFRLIVVFCAVLVVARAQTTKVNQCINSRGPLPINAYVQGCAEPPCQLPQLQNVVIDVIFRAPRTITNMTTLASASFNFIIGVSIPYDLGENSKTCNFFTNSFCPIREGEVVQYRLQMFIESFFVVGTLANAEFRIVDNDRNREVIWCIRLPIQITPPLPAITNGNEEQNPTPVLVAN
ncbi:uncharacterized protein LOC120628257 [Pararge aegeria]|uniref:Jg20867 protein n=1 Tax=Pararge aegeria aegeria TaxID=348720 RepID=A0A8S4R260_9NEOP|nr:uncharacterized protein LOC120628257 [Pararge aegeria]CAH2229495.1 jg20867 [Pararge aegeria aegeria]